MTSPGHVEQGGSWRPMWVAAGLLAVLVAVDAAVPAGLPALAWLGVAAVVLGVLAAGCLSARRLWTVRIDGRGEDTALVVGRERVPLTRIDAAHLAAVRRGTAGVDAGAPVLGGGWSLPKGRAGLPLRLTDGHTVLVPTRRPAELADALLGAHPAGRGSPASPQPEDRGTGTLGP